MIPATAMEAAAPEPPPADETALRAAIDRSVRWPVLVFFGHGFLWLMLALAAGFLANCRLVWPGGPGSLAALSYPRLQPAHLAMLAYGWGCNLAFGTMLWLMARLCRREARGAFTFVVAGAVWNLVVLAGVGSVLAGHGTGFAWLEFPRGAWPVLFASYAVIAGKLLVLFRCRAGQEGYISLHYLVAALFAFPWLLLTAWVFLFVAPGAAVMSTAVNLWYVGGLQALFFTPVALAALSFLIPKVTGRAGPASNLARAGFWGLVGVGAWTGLQPLVGGPLPAWMPVLSAAACFVLVIPALVVFLGLRAVLDGAPGFGPTLRFAAAGLWAFLGVVVLGALLAYGGWYVAFSMALAGQAYAHLLGFFGMAAFAAVAFIMPRVTGCEWPSRESLRTHFWFAVCGIGLLVAFSVAGGFQQGVAVADFQTGWRVVLEKFRPYVAGRLFAFALLFVINLFFLRSFVAMLLGPDRPAEAALPEQAPDPGPPPRPKPDRPAPHPFRP